MPKHIGSDVLKRGLQIPVEHSSVQDGACSLFSPLSCTAPAELSKAVTLQVQSVTFHSL